MSLPLLPFTWTDIPTAWRRISETINSLIKQVTDFYGGYNSTFGSGYVAYGGPDNSLQGNTNFIFGLELPNGSGIDAPGILIGGAGQVRAVIITDEQLPGQDGIELFIAAGETTSSGTDDGGVLRCLGGGSFGGTGGEGIYQGGTSLNGTGGGATLHGGNSTNGIPGDAFVIGGETGTQGANVHLIATKLAGVAGDIRFRFNSVTAIQLFENGEIYLTLSGTGAGLAGQPLVSGGVGGAAKWLSTGYTGSVALAKLTALGANGSLTVASGIITGYTAPT